MRAILGNGSLGREIEMSRPLGMAPSSVQRLRGPSPCGKLRASLIPVCRRSSGAEHVLGKDGVGGSIPLGGTRSFTYAQAASSCAAKRRNTAKVRAE